MFILTKEFHFSSAHRLLHLSEGNHKCNNLHGHNYSFILKVWGSKLGKDSMLIDYYKLSEIVKPIVQDFDHSTLVTLEDDALIEACIKLGSKVVILPIRNTTCECLCTLFVSLFREKLKGLEFSVVLRESESSSCELFEGSTEENAEEEVQPYVFDIPDAIILPIAVEPNNYLVMNNEIHTFYSSDSDNTFYRLAKKRFL